MASEIIPPYIGNIRYICTAAFISNEGMKKEIMTFLVTGKVENLTHNRKRKIKTNTDILKNTKLSNV